MNQASHYYISLVWTIGVIILILAVCAIALRWLIAIFNLRREKVMRVVFLIACLLLMVANAACAIASGFSHSKVCQDMDLCVLVPFAWIGDQWGLWRGLDGTPTFFSILAMWLLVMMTGLYLIGKGWSSFWALLLPPALAMMAYLLTSMMGWEFGK
jgi:hypothetical protein